MKSQNLFSRKKNKKNIALCHLLKKKIHKLQKPEFLSLGLREIS